MRAIRILPLLPSSKSCRALLALGSFALAGLLGAALPAAAADLFVVEAKGVELTPGQQLDGGKPLALAVGQRVTVVTADGRTLKLKGPFNEAPAPEVASASNTVATSLKGLIKLREADTTSAGIIRSGTAGVTPPSPWLIDVRHNGDRCVMAGQKAVLWRQDVAQTGSDLKIAPVDQSWSAKVAWPTHVDKLALPAALGLNDGQAYQVSVDAATVRLTLHVIPSAVTTDAARAAWMIEVGCQPQAKALIEAMN